MKNPISSRSGISALVIVVGILLLLSSAIVVAADTADGELSVAGSVETPTETVTTDELDSEFEVDAFATLSAGDSLDADIALSDDSAFDVYLYDNDGQNVDRVGGTGSDSVTFDTDSLKSGTYVLALYVDGNYIDIHPVIITGYDVTVDAPSEVSSDDESMLVSADVTPTALDIDPASVEIAVWDDDTVLRKTAEDRGDGQYEATFPMSDLEEGSYSVSAVAQGTDTVNGEREALGISDSDALTVSDSQDDSSDFDDGTDDELNESDDEPDESTDETDESDDEVADESEPGESNDTDDANDSSDDTNGVQQPNLEDDDDTETDTDDSDAVPLAVVPVVAVAAVLVGVVVRVRY